MSTAPFASRAKIGAKRSGVSLRGRLAARLGKFPGALAYLDQGLTLYAGDEFEDLCIPFLSIRGEVKERLGDRSGAIQDYEEAVNRTAAFCDLLADDSRIGMLSLAEDSLDRLFILNVRLEPQADTTRALHWAEYAKSRGLAALLGQSATLPAPSPQYEALLVEENELLSAVHGQRAASLALATPVDLDQRRALQVKRARLNAIWDRLEPDYPEYVELRRGAVPSWSEIADMTAD